MSQPVVDTLQLCDALRKTGMERDQAEGVARALGKELGAHVVAQNDLQAGFQEVRGEIHAVFQQTRNETQAAFQQARSETQAAFQQARSETQAAFQQARDEIRAVDHKVDLCRSELGGRIDVLDGKIESVKTELGTRFDAIDGRLKTLTTAVSLGMAFLALVTTILGLVTTIGVFQGETPAPSAAPQQAAAAAPPFASTPWAAPWTPVTPTAPAVP